MTPLKARVAAGLIVLVVGVLVLRELQPPPASSMELGDYGQAPELVGITHWLNSEPLTLASLRGKVVLVDFWTFACSNCLATLPYVEKWHDTYASRGLVIVGVHTPEFAFERDTANVAKAIARLGVRYAVAQDNDYATWKAYRNQYWPALHLIDRDGNIVLQHFGEGDYDEIEAAIRTVLDRPS